MAIPLTKEIVVMIVGKKVVPLAFQVQVGYVEWISPRLPEVCDDASLIVVQDMLTRICGCIWQWQKS